MDNIERFESDVIIPNPSQIKDILKKNNEPVTNSVASNSYANLEAASNSVQGSIKPNDENKGYTSTSGSYIPAKGDSFVGDTSNDIDDGNSCFIRDRLTSSDLLPLDSANSKWAQINPAGSGMLGDQNFLTAGYHVGINTIGQSLRNANLQLRSEPPNPQVAVSPWLISTI